MDLTPEQIQQKLRNKVGEVRIGGKGTQRRKVKVVSKQTGASDKAVRDLVKKFGAQPIGVDEVNFFMDDNTVMHFENPESFASIQSNVFIVSGEPQTKTIKDLLPDIITQLGPKQHAALKELVGGSNEEDDAPQLVAQKPADLDKTD